MPALALPAFWGAVSAGAAGAAGIYGAKKQGQASKEATAASTASNAAAIDEQKRQDAITQANFEKTLAAQQAQWDAQQNIRAPYRQAGSAALTSLGDMLGENFSGGGGSTGGAPSAGPTGALPSRPADLTSALKVANDTAYGFEKHTDPAYWDALWKKDPEYAFRRLLGEGAGPSDAAVKGPYAGAGAGSSASGTRRAAVPLAPSIVVPAGNALAPNYAPVIPFSQMIGRA